MGQGRRHNNITLWVAIAMDSELPFPFGNFRASVRFKGARIYTLFINSEETQRNSGKTKYFLVWGISFF